MQIHKIFKNTYRIWLLLSGKCFKRYQHRVYLFLFFFFSLSCFAQETELKLYRPFSHLNVNVSGSSTNPINGQCLGQSKHLTRKNAWRCQAEGQVYDPCFLKPSADHQQLLCFESPWSKTRIELSVPHPLVTLHRASLDMSRDYPWAVELENGTRCLSTHTKDRFDNLVVRYRCPDHSLLIGHLQRCDPFWSILRKDGHQVATIKLIKAWF